VALKGMAFGTPLVIYFGTGKCDSSSKCFKSFIK